MAPQKQVTFTRLKAVDRDIAYLGTMPDGQELGTPFTAICQYNAGNWSYDAFPLALADMALFKDAGAPYRTLFILFETGTVVDLHSKRSEIVLPVDDPIRIGHRLGYLTKIASIGDGLYVAGNGGQVFKRSTAKWEIVDTGFLDGPDQIMDPTSELSIASRRVYDEMDLTKESVDRYNLLSKANRSKTLWSIAGSSERDIYVCCEKAAVHHYDGASFRAVPTEADAALLAILIESQDRVWVCGREGTLLRGNHREGFRQVPGVADYPALSSMAWFDGKLYLGSYADPRGLLVYEGGRLRRVRSGLEPDIEDVSMIEAVDGVLWVMGTKDLLRFDGQRWERIDFPSNVPLR